MKKGIIITTIVIVLAFTTANAYAEDIQTGASLEVVADKDEVLRTQNVNLELKGSNLNDLYTMQVEVRYDPMRLELDQASIKNLIWEFNQNGYNAIQADIKTGVVNIIYSRKGKVAGVSANNNLVSLQFKTLRIGRATVEVRNVKLVNSQGNMIKTATTSISKEINILPNPLNVKLTGVKGQNDWFISDVMVDINDLDANEIYYTLDGIRYDYTQPFSISTIGQHNLKVTTNDGYDYIKEKEELIKLDYNRTLITVNNQCYDWQNTDLKVKPIFDEEGGSGVFKAWYQWTDSTEEPASWEEYNQGELIQPVQGIWYLHIKTVDYAGNASQTVFGSYKLDKTVPVISIDCDKRDWGITDILVIPIFADEGGSQIKFMGYQWSLDPSAPSEYTHYTLGSLQLTNERAWYLHLKVEDHAGNRKTVTYGPYKIDKTNPVIEFSGVTEGMDYTDTVTPIIPIYDTVSGIKAEPLLLDGQPYVSGTAVTEQGTHTITASADDFAGNTTAKSIMFKVYASTTLTLDIPQVEYSDTYTINATLTSTVQSVSGAAIVISHNQPVSGAAITIRLNGADMGSFYTDAQGNAVLSGITLSTAGTYMVDASYLQDDSRYYRASQSQSSLVVNTEKNSLIYTGSIEVLYPGIMTVSAFVDQDKDGYPGDITLARLKVDIIKENPDGSTTLLESFITNANPDGTIAYERNYDLGVYTTYITLLEDGYYTSGYTYATVPVFQESKSDVSCGGWLLLSDPVTSEPVKVTCNFNVRYKTNGADGTFKLFFEEAGIHINDGNITWLVLDGNTAQFQGSDGTYTYRLACIDDFNKDYISLRIWSGTDTSAPPVLEIINQEQEGGSINVKDNTGGDKIEKDKNK